MPNDPELEEIQDELKKIAMDDSRSDEERERAREGYNLIEDGKMEEAMQKLGLIRVEVPEQEVIDLGDYCVDCRRDVSEGTEWFASRRPAKTVGNSC